MYHIIIHRKARMSQAHRCPPYLFSKIFVHFFHKVAGLAAFFALPYKGGLIQPVRRFFSPETGTRKSFAKRVPTQGLLALDLVTF